MRSASILAIVSGLALAACSFVADAQQGDPAPVSGAGNQRSYQVGAFTGVTLAGPHDVVVTVGPAASVRAEGDERALERLEIRTDGNTLRIGTRRGVSHTRAGDVTVYVTVPSLSEAAIAGSGDMRIDTVRTEAFRAAIGGSGDMEVGALQARQAQVSIAGSGNVRMRGSAERLAVSIAGSGDVAAGDLRTTTADISIVGSGGVTAFVAEAADVSIMGSGDVNLRGPGRCTVSRMGSGEVRCNA